MGAICISPRRHFRLIGAATFVFGYPFSEDWRGLTLAQLNRARVFLGSLIRAKPIPPSTLKRDSSRLFGRQRQQARSSTWVYSSGALRSLTSAGSRSRSAEETERVTPARIPQHRIPQIRSVPDRIQFFRVDPLGARRADRSLIPPPLRRTISATIFRSKRVPIRSRGVRTRTLDAGDVNGWRACDSSANGLRI